jgi:hypothetical protein
MILETIAGFFRNPKYQYPEGDEGLLMRRHMAHQSWFDSLSHRWFETSFFTKTIYFLAVTLTSAWLGLLIGAATLFVLTAGVVFALTHTLLSSHETSRRAGAELAAKENISLAKQLSDSKQLLDRATAQSNQEAANLHQQAEAVVIEIGSLDTQTRLIEQRNEQLSDVIITIEEETTALCDKERLARKELEDLSDELGHCKDTIHQSAHQIEAFEDSLAKGTIIADKALKNQERLSAAIDRFSLFAQAPGKSKDPSFGAEHDDYIRQLRADNEADRLLIESYRKILNI